MEDKPKVTPKEFFVWAGAMITLYASVFAFIALLFAYIDYTFPDQFRYYAGDPYAGGVSYYMASLIVLLPISIVLMRLLHRDIERDPSRAEVWIRRWVLYLTLFVAGATIAGDLITLVMYFFNGDVTVRFLLKVLVVLLVAAGGFLHFLADLRGYWGENPAKARLIGWATGALAVLAIVAGFFIIGTPWEAREFRYDEQRVGDLQNVQYQIINYWQAKAALPATLDEAVDPLYGGMMPRDPETGDPYEYRVTGEHSFELCATFAAPAQATGKDARTVPMLEPAYGPVAGNDVWQHGEGRTCFVRTIDPDRYPPFEKPVPAPAR